MKRKKNRYMVVDLETTGNQPNRGDRIIQFAGTLVEDDKVVETYTTFINPERNIPPFIHELTGISHADVREAPLFEDVAPTIKALLADTIFVAHNVTFDWTFLQKELNRVGIDLAPMKKLDTVELARILFPGADSYKLQDLTDEFGFCHENPHRADSDAEVTAKLLLHCLEKLASLPLAALQKMSIVAQSLKNDLPELIFQMEMQKERENAPLSPDIIIHRGLAIRRKKIERPLYPIHEGTTFPETDTAKKKLFKQAGSPLYPRTGQFQMMDTIYKAMKADKHALIEAGTGIGKSLGYFLPSLYFAKQKQLPVIISTYTNLLQSQLYQQDVPLAKKLTGFDVLATLLKGRDHYLNLFKFEQLLNEADPQYDVVVTKLKLIVWLTETTTGDIDEVNLSSGGELFWNRMKHTGWYLSEQKDPWLAFDFYKFNLEQAKHADFVIVNHALLLSDHFAKKKLLPEYNYAVVDEAHHFTESARMQGSFTLTYRKLKYFLNQLGSLDNYSLLSRLALVLGNDDRLIDLDMTSYQLNEAVELLFTSLHQYLLANKKGQTERTIVENTATTSWDEANFYAAEKVLLLFKEASQLMADLLASSKNEESELNEAESAFIEEMYSFLLDFVEMSDQLDQMLNSDKNKAILTIYIQADKNRSLSSLRLKATLIDIESILRNQFFAQKKSVILTSATLTVNGQFAYLKKELGLVGMEIEEIRIPSPFHYEENVRILVPTDMPPIKGTAVYDYTKELAQYLAAIATRTKGRMLVLFTANDMLRQTLDHMKQIPELAEFVLLAQGVTTGSTMRLTKQFQLFDKAILLGTNSFWEGIDIPGEALLCLVIVRLPFAPLNDSYTKAQIDIRKSRGENAFQTYSLPEAILKFKQGFGRLIRRETDRGIIFVVDNRIDTTKFGNSFLNSIPQVPQIKGDKAKLLKEISNFFLKKDS